MSDWAQPTLLPMSVAEEKYIAAATSPFDRLARAWEVGSARRGIDRSKPTPRDVMDERWRQLWALWEQEEKK